MGGEWPVRRSDRLTPLKECTGKRYEVPNVCEGRHFYSWQGDGPFCIMHEPALWLPSLLHDAY